MNPDNEQALAVCAVCSADVQAHHRLIRDDSGKRLAKRDDARCVVTIAADRGDRYFAPMRWEKRYEW